VHEDRQEPIHERLSNPTPHHRMAAKVDRKRNADKAYTPQITALGIQKGLERGAEDVFHRLHHGPKDIAVVVDPATEKEDHEIVEQTTKRLLKSQKPLGISDKAWEKVQRVQLEVCQRMKAGSNPDEESYEDEVSSPSPLSAGFPQLEAVSEGSPDSAGDFSAQELISPAETPNPMSTSSNTFSASAQPPMSARTVSSAATRSTTPQISEAGIFTGKVKMKDFLAPRGEQQPEMSPSSSVFAAGTPLEEVLILDEKE